MTSSIGLRESLVRRRLSRRAAAVRIALEHGAVDVGPSALGGAAGLGRSFSLAHRAFHGAASASRTISTRAMLSTERTLRAGFADARAFSAGFRSVARPRGVLGTMEGAVGEALENLTHRTAAGVRAVQAQRAGNLTETLQAVPSSGAVMVGTAGRTTTILGRFYPDLEPIVKEVTGGLKAWDIGPKPGRFNVLNVPDGVYGRWGADAFWELFNKPWLDAAIKRGDEIILATRPAPSTLFNSSGQLTGFGSEYKYLPSQGFCFDPVTNRMVQP